MITNEEPQPCVQWRLLPRGEAVGEYKPFVIFDFCTLFLLSAAAIGKAEYCNEMFNQYIK